MLRMLTRAFAFVGFLLTLIIVGGAIFIIHQQEKTVPEPDSVVLVVDFDQPIVEQNEPSPFDIALHQEATSLVDILSAINKAKDDPHVKGLVGRFGSSQPSLALRCRPRARARWRCAH